MLHDRRVTPQRLGCYLGLDLGWTTGATGLALVDGCGRVVASGRAGSDEEIVAWIAAHSTDVAVAAFDAPLVVPNETGQRVAEREIGQHFGRFGASAHACNRGRFGGGPPRAWRLSQQLGWATDPRVAPGHGAPVAIEVYPHPALIALCGLGYRLDYKKGSQERRLPGFRALLRCLESIPELRLDSYPRWAELRTQVSTAHRGVLNRVEDEVDAIVCAHLAWLWHRRPDALRVYGDHAEGYIVAPPPPAHPAVRPGHQ